MRSCPVWRLVHTDKLIIFDCARISLCGGSQILSFLFRAPVQLPPPGGTKDSWLPNSRCRVAQMTRLNCAIYARLLKCRAHVQHTVHAEQLRDPLDRPLVCGSSFVNEGCKLRFESMWVNRQFFVMLFVG